MVDQIFSFALKRRSQIIFIFKLVYLTQLVLLYLGIHSVLFPTDSQLFYYYLALNFGRAGLVFYTITLIPGIFRRFGIKHKLISIIMIFRRYFGIAMYLSILIHFFTIRGTRMFLTQNFAVLSRPTFEIMGIGALLLTLPMFLTSNDLSVKTLGVWWKWIHKLTYIIIWFIMLHVILQRVSLWSILISIVLITQIASFLYSFMYKRLLRGQKD